MTMKWWPRCIVVPMGCWMPAPAHWFGFAAPPLAPWLIGGAGMLFGVTALALSLGFAALAIPVASRRSGPDDAMLPEKRLFKYSILYLVALFAVLVLDRVLAHSGTLA